MTFVAIGCLIISLLIVRSHGTSAAAILLLFYTICFATYGVVFDFSLRKADIFGTLGLSYTATPLSEHPTSTSSVILLYAILSGALASIASIAPRRTAAHSIGNIFPRLTSGQAAVISILMMGYLFMTVWHAMAIDWSTLSSFTDYVSLKHPEGLGLTSPSLRIYHFFMKSGGPILFCAGIFVFAGGRRLLGLSLVLLSLYGFVFNAVTSSRYVIAYPAIVVALSLYRRQYGWAAMGTFLLLFLFNMSIVGRSQALHGFESMTFDFFGVVIFSMPQAALGIFLNVFDAFITFGAAVAIAPSYANDYMWLSFSPLPSFMDGFDSIADAAPRISVSVPFSSYAEAYLFGPWALSAQILVFTLFALSLQAWSRQTGVLSSAASMGWMLIVNQLLCQYPIRNSFRFLLLTVLAIAIWQAMHMRTRNAPVPRA